MSWLIYGFVVDDLMISAQNFVTVPVFIYMTLKAAKWRADNPNYVSVSA
jgi:ABC-type transport system involved in Fe-S cluster assembly fused permease/ATPase subunit